MSDFVPAGTARRKARVKRLAALARGLAKEVGPWKGSEAR